MYVVHKFNVTRHVFASKVEEMFWDSNKYSKKGGSDLDCQFDPCDFKLNLSLWPCLRQASGTKEMYAFAWTISITPTL